MMRNRIFIVVSLMCFGIWVCCAQSTNIQFPTININDKQSAEEIKRVNQIIDECQNFIDRIASNSTSNEVKMSYIKNVSKLLIGNGQDFLDADSVNHHAVMSEIISGSNTKRRNITTLQFLKQLSLNKHLHLIPKIISAQFYVADLNNITDVGNGKYRIVVNGCCKFISGRYCDVSCKKISLLFDKTKIDGIKGGGIYSIYLLGETAISISK